MLSNTLSLKYLSVNSSTVRLHVFGDLITHARNRKHTHARAQSIIHRLMAEAKSCQSNSQTINRLKQEICFIVQSPANYYLLLFFQKYGLVFVMLKKCRPKSADPASLAAVLAKAARRLGNDLNCILEARPQPLSRRSSQPSPPSH